MGGKSLTVAGSPESREDGVRADLGLVEGVCVSHTYSGGDWRAPSPRGTWSGPLGRRKAEDEWMNSETFATILVWFGDGGLGCGGGGGGRVDGVKGRGDAGVEGKCQGLEVRVTDSRVVKPPFPLALQGGAPGGEGVRPSPSSSPAAQAASHRLGRIVLTNEGLRRCSVSLFTPLRETSLLLETELAGWQILPVRHLNITVRSCLFSWLSDIIVQFLSFENGNWK